MNRLFSGIQPSGIIHIGNYLGAIRNWIRLMESYQCLYCVVDYHAITIPYDPAELRSRSIEAAKTLIAAGIDPERCILFIQSAVPEHTELAWILNTVTSVAALERMTQYKDKRQQHAENINTGLLTYPVLMAADILLYRAAAVPVGDDQKQHLELTREIARAFNSRFGDTFPEPETLVGEGARIRGLDGSAKMSKSLNNYIALTEEADELWQKLRTAVTDPARVRRSDPGNPHICNVFSLHQCFSSEDEIATVEQGCRTASIGCVDCKKMLAANIDRAIEPVRERKHDLDQHSGEVIDILESGRKKAASIARATMEEIREKIGVDYTKTGSMTGHQA
jgi:tryptophanyl-tRNA synthetase